jgi:hypothetical protein
MSNILDTLKEKYFEEVGLSFTFFEMLTFLMYVIVSYIFFCEPEAGIWNSLLFKSIDDILLSEGSVISKVRIADLLCSGLMTLSTIAGYKRFSGASYECLSTVKDMDEYVKKLREKYDIEKLGGQAMRIYIANAAKEQKQEYMKKIAIANGVGLISLVMAVSALIGFRALNRTDSGVLIVSLIVLFFMQWTVFAKYTSQVAPRLVLERMARGEDVKFGEEMQQ